MTAANGKTIIGLTGKIATGKSVVRRMLEHLGAYTIDADALSHRVMEQDGPAYQPTIDLFGKFILADDGRIDRQKLGTVAFSNAEAMKSLEKIIHPYVRKAANYLIERASQDVIVIEAIKLKESGLFEECDWIWVVTSSEENQIARMSARRGLSEEEARQRIIYQAEQKLEVPRANVLIKNDGNMENIWKQVQAGWTQLFPWAEIPEAVERTVSAEPAAVEAPQLATAELYADRGKPGNAQSIADLINKLSGDAKKLSRIDIMESFGEKAYMLLLTGDQLVGVMGWQVENLIVRIDEIWLEVGLNYAVAVKILMDAIEVAAKELQAEAALAFVPKHLNGDLMAWTSIGYSQRTPEELTVNAWREAAEQEKPEAGRMLFKQLRVDRVLRPI